ncbi:MAG: hypothetical protein K6T31_09775, partial [Alicyclobacillus sp.]|nr:hypothetical protein [Alicyclobacillus sp.]
MLERVLRGMDWAVPKVGGTTGTAFSSHVDGGVFFFRVQACGALALGGQGADGCPDAVVCLVPPGCHSRQTGKGGWVVQQYKVTLKDGQERWYDAGTRYADI